METYYYVDINNNQYIEFLIGFFPIIFVYIVASAQEQLTSYLPFIMKSLEVTHSVHDVALLSLIHI